MKTFICLGLLFAAVIVSAQTVKLWDGKERGMDLVAVGHKRVTIYLSDGRTSVIGIPILVETPQTRTNGLQTIASSNHVDHAAQKR